MPNHKSAEKRMRQNERRKGINRSNRTRLRTEIKKLRAALSGGDKDALQTVLSRTMSPIDKSVHKGVLHKNASIKRARKLKVSQTIQAAARRIELFDPPRCFFFELKERQTEVRHGGRRTGEEALQRDAGDRATGRGF